MRLDYNPFGKRLEALTVEDLGKLREVSEGWYVEYKRELPLPRDIGKSVSAFANQYGGWLFIGVDGSKDIHNVACDFPGITDLSDGVMASIRDAVTSHVNPSPEFHMRAIRGPSSAIGLSSDRAVVICLVPYSWTTPHVHSSGRIYVRLGDKSNPVPATTQSLVTDLVKRRDLWRERIRALVGVKPILSEREERNCIFTLYLHSNPFIEQSTSLHFDAFDEVCRSPSNSFAGMALENTYSAGHCYVARQTMNNDPFNHLLTLRHFFDGSTVAHIPVNSGEIDEPVCPDFADSYQRYEEFIDACARAGHRSGYWMDFNYVLVVMAEIISKHRRLCQLGDIEEDSYFKLRLQNCWRRVAFVDSPVYIDAFKKHGPPIIQDDEILVPGQEEEALAKLATQDDTDDIDSSDLKYRPLLAAVGPWVSALRAVGLEYLVREDTAVQVVMDMYSSIVAKHGSNDSNTGLA